MKSLARSRPVARNYSFRVWRGRLTQPQRENYAERYRGLRERIGIPEFEERRVRGDRSWHVWNEARPVDLQLFYLGLELPVFKEMIARAIRSKGRLRVLDIGCGLSSSVAD